jgi:hypothetical protein
MRTLLLIRIVTYAPNFNHNMLFSYIRKRNVVPLVCATLTGALVGVSAQSAPRSGAYFVLNALRCSYRVHSMVDAYHGESVISGLVPSKYGSLYHLSIIE